MRLPSTRLQAWHAVVMNLAAAPVSNPGDNAGGVDEVVDNHHASCLLCSDNIFGKIGASAVWLGLLFWAFLAMAIVADDHLMPALEELSTRTKLPMNVAAATFLAFGSAVPEIMTSIISTVRGSVDVSLPAILGSGCIAYGPIPAICCISIQPYFMSTKDRMKAKTGTDVATFYRRRPLPVYKIRRNSTVAMRRRKSVTDTLTSPLSNVRSSLASSSESNLAGMAGGGSSPENQAPPAAPVQTRERAKSELVNVTGLSLGLRLELAPLVRDVGVYLTSLLVTLWFMQDTKMNLIESAVLVNLYVTYIVVLYCTKDVWGEEGEEDLSPEEEQQRAPLLLEDRRDGYGSTRRLAFLDDDDDGFLKNDDAFSPAEEQPSPRSDMGLFEEGKDDDNVKVANDNPEAGDKATTEPGGGQGSGSGTVSLDDHALNQNDDEEVNEQGCFTCLVDYAEAPFHALFYYTIPDCLAAEPLEQVDAVKAELKLVSSRLQEAFDSLHPSHKAVALLEFSPTKREKELAAMSAGERIKTEVAEKQLGGIKPAVRPKELSNFDDLMHVDSECLQRMRALHADVEWYRVWAPFTFTMSIFYISILAFLTLSLVHQFCLTLGIPKTLSGVTLVALGAEVPDAIASIACAKGGHGPSAVSNCLNSQIINLLIGLGLPYLIHNIMTHSMHLGDAGSTETFIAALLAVLVVAFLMCTIGQQKLLGKDQPSLTVDNAALLLSLYTVLIVSVSIWAVMVEGHVPGA